MCSCRYSNDKFLWASTKCIIAEFFNISFTIIHHVSQNYFNNITLSHSYRVSAQYIAPKPFVASLDHFHVQLYE